MASNQRLAAILFTDIAGYTALMGRNKSEAMEVLQMNRSIHQELIRAFGGVYVKEIGDGTLAYFNSAHEAVTCAVAIQERVGDKMSARLRMGIHLGEVIFENDDVFGDGVNIASRVQPLAEPGGICITESVASALRSYEDIPTKYLGKAKLKNVSIPVAVHAVAGKNLVVPARKQFAAKSSRRKAIPLKPANIVVVVGIPAIIVVLLVLNYNKKIEYSNARNSLADIQNMVDSSWRDYSPAYYLAKQIQKIIPDNPQLRTLLKQSSMNLAVTSEPAGARVYVKEYKHPEKEWQYLGETPLKDVELPITILRWKLVKEGYDTVLAVASSFRTNRENLSRMTKENMHVPNDFHRILSKKGAVPADMVRVKGGTFPYGTIPDFFIDQYEVRNKEFKQFVDAGGYRNPDYWKYPFLDDDGRALLKEEALARFTDKTGQPGPAVWEAGTYPDGEGNFPVRGVSWYEAAAYAAFAGKSLPTTDHWGLARGDQTYVIQVPQVGGYALFAPFSNFNHKGPVAAGSLPGITSYGAFDMAGNVREWCWNESPRGRSMRGGAWNDNTYLFRQPIQAPAFDRSETNGFRCMYATEPDSIPEAAFRPTTNILPTLAKLPDPVSDETFNHFKSFYGYDKTDLHQQIISRKETARDWVLEKIRYDAAYNNESITAYLFLPKNIPPPYQTVVYLPGVAAFFQQSSSNIEDYYEFPVFLDFIVKTGRAVLFPVYTGTFERINDFSTMFSGGPPPIRTHQFTEFTTRYFKDVERSIDYLETRNDINPEKIALYGMSHGTIFVPIFSSMDSRIKANIMLSGGMAPPGRPESSELLFLPRVRQPTLMINGKYDSVMGEENIRTAFRLLGAAEKELKLFETDHIPPHGDMVRETLAWLDKYLGPVN